MGRVRFLVTIKVRVPVSVKFKFKMNVGLMNRITG